MQISYKSPNSLHQPWWANSELSWDENGLLIDNAPVADLAAEIGTPLYLYSASSIRKRIAELRHALTMTGSKFKMHYAIKANRFKPVLGLIRNEGDVGIDASSPREAILAMETGFSKNDLSVTVSMPSNRDLKQFAELGLHLNLDSKSAIRRWAETPGASKNIGLRIDPAVAIGYGDNAKLSYGNSKFGVGLDKVLETAQFAEQLGFTIDTIHMHAGWGLQQKVSGVFEEILAQIADLVGRIKSVKVVNVGGGLCWKQTSADQPLLLDSWSILLKKHIAPLGVTIFCESGTYVVASSGILVAEVNTVEERLKQNWIGIDAGHNVNVYAAHYGIPQEIIHVQNPLGEKEHDYVVAGNINESNDIFNRGTRLPKVLEGQHIALFPTGAYGASMASDHCMKGLPKEHLVE